MCTFLPAVRPHQGTFILHKRLQHAPSLRNSHNSQSERILPTSLETHTNTFHPNPRNNASLHPRLRDPRHRAPNNTTTNKLHQQRFHPLTNFYLLTSPLPLKSPSNNSSLLSSVSATSLFDPLAQTNYLLRVIGPGYNSLPQFNLTDGTLETEAAGPHGVGEFEYNSTRVRAGEDLMFAPAAQPKGNLGLVDGYLLSVGGKSEGWRVCDGDLGQQVVAWKGEDDSCMDTFVHAVKDAPY
ncbi:hypothetical protein Q7P35_009296 [Cladosporium inversicolor]